MWNSLIKITTFWFPHKFLTHQCLSQHIIISNLSNSLRTLRNKCQLNFNQNSYILIYDRAFQNVVWKMAAILSLPKCVNAFNICSVQCLTHYTRMTLKKILFADAHQQQIQGWFYHGYLDILHFLQIWKSLSLIGTWHSYNNCWNFANFSVMFWVNTLRPCDTYMHH